MNLELLKENVTHIGSYKDTDVFPLYVTVDDYDFEITNEGEVNDENIDSASGGGKKGLTVEEILEYVETAKQEAKQEAIQEAVQLAMDEMNENTKSIETKIDDTKSNLETKIDETKSNLDTKIDETKSNLETKINETKSDLENKINNEKASIKGEVYPVGSIYISISATNPSTLFGGTWERYGKGRTLVSVDEGQTEFSKVQNTGGAKTVALATGNLPKHNHSIPALSGTAESNGGHTHDYSKSNSSTDGTAISIAQMPAHTHSYSGSILVWYNGTANLDINARAGGWTTTGSTYHKSSTVQSTGGGQKHSHTIGFTTTATTKTGAHTHSVTTTKSTTGDTGSGTAFSVLNPYITVYIWRRTA